MTPSATATGDDAGDVAAVRASFEGYTRAALGKDGPAASARVASPVHDFYDSTRDAALTSTEKQLREESVSYRFTVYALRAAVQPDALRRATPEKLIEIAIDKGLVGEQGIRNLALGAVETNGDRASAEALVQGRPAPFRFEFLREDGQWKIDLQPLLRLSDQAFQGAAAQQGLSTDELVRDTLVAQYGAKKAAALRRPLTTPR